MGIVTAVKGIVFAETEDAGKVSQVVWNVDRSGGTATLLVPVSAYDRYSRRASLRALHIKVPKAKRVVSTKVEYGVVQTPNGNYYLVRADFTV
jgi:hypothetical protein